MTDVLADIEAAAEQVAGDALAQTKARADASRKEDLDAREAALQSLAERMGVTVEDAMAEERRARHAELAEKLDDLLQQQAVTKDAGEVFAMDREIGRHVKGWAEYVESQPAAADLELRLAAANAELLEARRQWKRGNDSGYELPEDGAAVHQRLTTALETWAQVDREHELATDNAAAAAMLREYASTIPGGTGE